MHSRQSTKNRNSSGGSQFYLDIRYHQNSSWQGSVQRLDTGETVNFRSALELMTLIEAAARQQAPEDENQQLRRWKMKEEVGKARLGKHKTCCKGTNEK